MRYKLFYRRGQKKGKRGVALILTFMIMATVMTVTIAFLFMLNTRSRGTAFDVASHKALWVAEAGLQSVIYRLRTDIAYRNDPTQVSGSVGNGSYSVTVVRDGSTYTLTSTGSVDVVERELSQSVIVTSAFPDAFGYALFGDTNSSRLRLRNNVAVSGDLYYDGDVRIDANASVTDGLVYGDTVDGAGTYTEAPGPPDPVPAYPTFDTTYYDDEISTGEAMSPGNFTLNGTDDLDLAGGTLYYRDFTAEDDATITGPGTIVATDDIEIKDNVSISPNVTLISKDDLTVRGNAVVQSGAILYGRDKILLRDDADVTGSLLVPTNNKVATMQDSATLTGIIYADRVRLRNDAEIDGSVMADDFVGDRIQNNVDITFDDAALPDTVPTGFESGGITVVPQRDWNEN